MFILIFILTLLVLVVIHEFGHYIACKKFGIKVLEFGFGIPPRIWGKKIGETLWSINLLPIGGFVNPLGQDEIEKGDKDYKRSFLAQDVKKRIIVVLAGVFMNLLLAWVLFYGVLIAQNFKIIYPTLEPVAQIGEVEKDYPAFAAGLKEGDQILAINGQKISSPEQVSTLIEQSKGSPVTLNLGDIEGKNQRTITVTPKEVKPGDYKIGIVFSPFPFKQYNSLGEKLTSGITYSADVTKLTFVGLGKLFTNLGQRDFQQASQSVSGPVGMVMITRNIVDLGTTGITLYLWFVGVLSLTLAIFNVLPIPALDGGRLFFLFIEFITGKKPNPEFERVVHTVGMVVLLSLMLLITYSDIRKFF